MKKLALPLAVLALALSLYVSDTPVQAQSAQTKWEYKVFRMDPTEYSTKSDYQAILRQEGARKADAVFKQRVLDYLGKEGWELVTMEVRQQNLIYYYLKRRAG